MKSTEVTRNPLEIAELEQCSLSEAKRMVRDCTETLPGWGRLELQPYIISRRHVSHPWPKDQRFEIEHYRRLHDQGRVNMCQGRDGSYFILYAIPNAHTVDRESYFYTEGFE